MIIEGCILIVLSVLTVIFSLATQNVQVKNGLKKVDGVITVSDIQNQEVTVEYTINNTVYSSVYRMEAHAKAGELPPVGLKIQVSVAPQKPEKIVFLHLMREMGRGLSGEHKYINNQGTTTGSKLYLLAFLLLATGIYLILHGMKII